MLKNAESQAELNCLNVESLVFEHVQMNKVPKRQPRIYRAQGRINPSTSSWNKELLCKKRKIPEETKTYSTVTNAA